MSNNRCNQIKLSLIIFVFLYLNHNMDVTAHKIVITTIEGGSHILGKVALGKALVDHGNEVYLVVSERLPNKQIIWDAGIKTLEYSTPSDAKHSETDETRMRIRDFVANNEDPQEIHSYVAPILYANCEHMMNDTKMLEKIRYLNVDLFIVSPFYITSCNAILPVYFGKPFVSMALNYVYLQLRTPALPSFVAVNAAPLTTDNIHKYGLTDKLKSIFNSVISFNLWILYEEHKTDFLKQYAPQYKTWPELTRQSELFLLEADHHLGGFVPSLPNFINIAGHLISSTKPLKSELQEIMNQAVDGVVLFSFGSMTYFLPDDVIYKLLQSFSMIKLTVLARIPAPKNMTVPPNVKLMRWFSQNDLLAHKNTRLFITHCGNNGQYEALHNGVPMLGFPLFSDQHINARRIEERGYGLEMNIHTFTADELVQNIHEVLYNEKYRRAIGKSSERWKEHFNREHPLDRAVFWIEHVIKHGGKHLRSPSLDLSLYEFLMLDVLLFILLAASLSVCLLVWVFIRVLSWSMRGYKGSQGVSQVNGSHWVKASVGTSNDDLKKKTI